MPAVITQIADAVVAVLNAAVAAETLQPEFEAVAVKTIDYEQTYAPLTVFVLGKSEETEQIARDADEDRYVVEIYVTQKLEPETLDENTETLCLLVEAIKDHLRSYAGRIDGTVSGADRVGSQIIPLYDHNILRKELRFASSQLVTYAVGDGSE